ncbi:MAG: ATP-binding protein [Flavobacteriales bacterium]|nr:ATP-binding protein [Flavobacteriales bacterium]
MNTRIAIRINAQLEDLTKVEAIIDGLHEEGKLPEEAYGNILVVATEATLNAINHGSKSDSSKQIDFLLIIEGRTMTLEVSDSGKGFDFENLPDPTDPANLEKVNGRGIYIMRNLSDDLEFLNAGATVKVTFELESAVSVRA